MLNPETGVDEAKYYALVLTVAMHASAKLRRRAMTRLVAALCADELRRVRCRDVDAGAAVRVRAWGT